MTGTILAADIIVTMDATNSVLENSAIAIDGDRIVAIGALPDIVRDRAHWPVRHFPNRLLMPGLVNTHLHSGLLRGTAEGLAVWDWLRLYIDPMHRVLTAPEAEAASWLCYAEAVLSGTTTVVDMWRFMDGQRARRHHHRQPRHHGALCRRASGLRLFRHSSTTTRHLIETWHARPMAGSKVWVGLEHAFYADREGASPRHRARAEIRHRVSHPLATRPRSNLRRCIAATASGPMSAHWTSSACLMRRARLLAHCVWLDDAEIELIAKRGVAVAHNPISNMKLASGTAPVVKCWRAGVPVGIGTDGEKENNNLDMFEEMKVASLLASSRSTDAAALDSWDVLRMATIDGARAIGMDDEIGVARGRQEGRYRRGPHRYAAHDAAASASDGFNLHHNLVHAVQGGDVDLTMVDGKIVVEDGRLLTAHMPDLIAGINEAAPALFARRAAWLASNKSGAVSPFATTA